MIMDNRIPARLKIYLDEEIKDAQKQIDKNKSSDMINPYLSGLDAGRIDLAQRLIAWLNVWDK